MLNQPKQTLSKYHRATNWMTESLITLLWVTEDTFQNLMGLTSFNTSAIITGVVCSKSLDQTTVFKMIKKKTLILVTEFRLPVPWNHSLRIS